jgi:3-methylcrotonyl-CoA carboxylase alpha subunit
MIKSLLIANRGEIACRVIRTARKMGIHTIAVYSDADVNALHVREADEAYRLGAAPVAESYLRTGRILKIAKDAGADAIHPGYGFLSENADFAELCAEAGMIFVGPPPSAISAMGLKDRAKDIMKKAGVPVVPGYHGTMQQAEFLKRKAYETGYPVLIKAVAGGGGKGMRKVNKAIEFDAALESAMREAKSSFGNDHMLIEKFISSPRHIEIQIFADNHGNVVHLFERDCSLQRRHQKVIEEAPAPGMSEELRAIMGKAACDAARAVGYQGAGTVEFIVDGEKGLSAEGFYFMEMNTRLQVEHPVTELISGTDLVEWQLRVAGGERLPLTQDELQITGHSVEARVYAEDPPTGFLPSTGPLAMVSFPDDVRADTGVETGDEISPYYDPMIAKLIVHGKNRNDALDKLKSALENTVIAGPKTNIRFLTKLIDNQQFRSEKFDTGLIDENLEDLTVVSDDSRALSAAGIIALVKSQQTDIAARSGGKASSPWAVNDAFSGGQNRIQEFRYIEDGEVSSSKIQFDGNEIHVLDDDGNTIAPSSNAVLVDADNHLYAYLKGQQIKLEDYIASNFVGIGDTAGGASDGVVRVPMHGKIISVSVVEGDEVEEGDLLFAVEAMKMEHAVIAPISGVVAEFALTIGEQMSEGTVGLKIEATEE